MAYPTRKVLTAILIGLLLAVLSMIFLDQDVSHFFAQPELLDLWYQARHITNVGLSQHYFIAAALIYIFCRWIRPQYTKWRAWSRDFFFALLVSGIFIHVVKIVFGRQRPHLSPDFNPYIFHPFTLDWNYQSFASGHSQVMFTVATLLSLGFPKGKWFFILLAVFFASTRVIIHDHFLSDVIGGAVVGYVGSMTAIYWTHRWQNRSCLRARKSA